MVKYEVAKDGVEVETEMQLARSVKAQVKSP